MAAGAAAAAAVATAIRASGVLVRLEPDEFRKILALAGDPLVVVTTGGIFTANFQYLMSYKGLAFFTKSPTQLELPEGSEVVIAASIMIPG